MHLKTLVWALYFIGIFCLFSSHIQTLVYLQVQTGVRLFLFPWLLALFLKSILSDTFVMRFRVLSLLSRGGLDCIFIRLDLWIVEVVPVLLSPILQWYFCNLYLYYDLCVASIDFWTSFGQESVTYIFSS